jgi:hypothetical protein
LSSAVPLAPPWLHKNPAGFYSANPPNLVPGTGSFEINIFRRNFQMKNQKMNKLKNRDK